MGRPIRGLPRDRRDSENRSSAHEAFTRIIGAAWCSICSTTYKQAARLFKFFNKPYALLGASEFLGTEQVCWVDSDILFVGEPTDLILKPSEDFVACASDRNIGTNGDDEFTPYWAELARIFGVKESQSVSSREDSSQSPEPVH